MKKKAADCQAALACPCGTGILYRDCCARFHDGAAAPTAVQLMRARYSAYVTQDNAYLRATWHPSTRPATLDGVDDAKDEPGDEPGPTRWLGLEVRRQEETGDEATVEFVARYKQGGKACRLHEVSRFVREGGNWMYLDGSFPKEKKQ